MNIGFCDDRDMAKAAAQECEVLSGIDAELDAAILAMVKGGCGGGGGGGKKGKKGGGKKKK